MWNFGHEMNRKLFFVIVNLVVTVNGVCVWQNGKLDCQFHQSELGQTGPTAAAAAADGSVPTTALSNSFRFNYGDSGSGSGSGPTVVTASERGTLTRKKDASRLLWPTAYGQRMHQHQTPKPQPKVVRISAHRPSPATPSLDRRFLPFIDTDDEDLVSVSKVQVHEPDMEPQRSLISGFDSDYGSPMPVEVSHIAFPSPQRYAAGFGADLHDGHGHGHSNDAPPPPRRHDSEIEDIHSILPSLLDPVRIKKIMSPKNRGAHARASGRSTEHAQGPQIEEVTPVAADNVYQSSYSIIESHGQGQGQGNSHLQNSKTLSSPLLLKPNPANGATAKKKPFRIQILDSNTNPKHEHQKPGSVTATYGSPYHKKPTLLMPATKEYHEQYKVPYKSARESDVYANDYVYEGENVVDTAPRQQHPTQLVYQQQTLPAGPAPTPVYSTGPIVMQSEHHEAELKPMSRIQLQHQQASPLPPFLPQPQAYHAAPPPPQQQQHAPVPDQMMAESIHGGHGFYHQQQYLVAGGAYSSPAPQQYPGFAPIPAPAPSPAPYYQPYHAPAPHSTWSYNGHSHSMPTPTPSPAFVSQKENVLNALKLLSQSKPDLIKDVVSEHRHEGLGDDVVEFVSSATKNHTAAETHFYTKNGAKNKITVDMSSIANPEPKQTMPIEQVLSLLLSNQKYSSSGKNFFKNSFTKEVESGTQNHPNELAEILYNMGILERIATGTLNVEQMELVNKLIDLNHQEAELEEEIQFYTDKAGRKRKKKPAKYLVPRTASGGSGEGARRRSQSSYSAYEGAREEYESEKRRRRPHTYSSGSGSRYRSQEQRDRYRSQSHEDRRHYGRERDMLRGSDPGRPDTRHNDLHYQQSEHQQQQQYVPPSNMQPPSHTESPVNLNIIIPTDAPTPPVPSQKTLNDAIPSDTINFLATVELGHDQPHTGAGAGGTGGYTDAALNNFFHSPTPPHPIPSIIPYMSNVFKSHPILNRMKDEWWKGVGSMLNDMQRQQIYQQFGVDPGYTNYTGGHMQSGYSGGSSGGYGYGGSGTGTAHRQQGQSAAHTSHVMVQILSTIGLLSSFMLLAFIGVQMQKGSGILPPKVHFRNPFASVSPLLEKINPNKLPKIKGKPAAAAGGHKHKPYAPSPAYNSHGQGITVVAPAQQQQQHTSASSHMSHSHEQEQHGFTQSMEELRNKIVNDKQPYNLHIHFKGQDFAGAGSGSMSQSHEGTRGHDGASAQVHSFESSRPSGESEAHDDDDVSEDEDDEADAMSQLGVAADDTEEETDDDELEDELSEKVRTTAASTPVGEAELKPVESIAFDASFETYLKNAVRPGVGALNNPAQLLNKITPVSPTFNSIYTTSSPVFRRPSPNPPTTPETESTTTTTTTPAPTSTSTTTARSKRTTSYPRYRPRPRTRPTTATTSTTTTTTEVPHEEDREYEDQDVIESEETIITNTIVPNAAAEEEETTTVKAKAPET